MPKGTFLKLNPDKRKVIIEAFLLEFSNKSFDDASITRVVNKIGIAKGSIYQYFDNKLDLFLFLQQECSKVKFTYTGSINRADFIDFWSYYRALYEAGIEFDKDHPLESNFLHNIINYIKSPSLREISKDLMNQVVEWMSTMIQSEVDQGLFRNDKSVKSMAFLLFNTSNSIFDYMQTVYGFDIDKRITRGKSVYAENNGEILMKTVDEYIFLLKDAFNKKDYDKS